MPECKCEECGSDASDGASGLCYECWKSLAKPTVVRLASWHNQRDAIGRVKLAKAFSRANAGDRAVVELTRRTLNELLT
jgi:hypothetical protein